ncbi:MAG TPA: hydroxymethylglutaryl-CoA lyase [Candidatus Lustribacter sp.]
MNDPYAAFPKQVTICEVGPRDGLQNEARTVAAADKVRYIEMLVDAGVTAVEATSFVSPSAVPQLADADVVFPAIRKRAGVRYIALVPNARGLERAIAAGVQEIAVFTAASETFAQRNIRTSIDASLATFGSVIARAHANGMRVRASVSTAFGCPFEGAVPVANVVRVSQALLDAGADSLSIADTIGVATPNQVIDVASALLGAGITLDRFGLHFHDTRGTALANIMAGLQLGVREYDASSGGLGGCPFAPGATGNVATEDVLYLLHGMGIATGIDIERLRDASRFIDGVLGGRVVSRAYRALEAAAARSV